MDRVACCRRAAREAIADVEPSRLHELLVDVIDDATMTPGVLALETAAAVDPEADLEEVVAPLAAGVQLIYEGLRLTRSLARAEPWRAAREDVTEADLEILAADILVARGFYLLARSEAAEQAVGTLRAFGRNQRADDGRWTGDEAAGPSGDGTGTEATADHETDGGSTGAPADGASGGAPNQTESTLEADVLELAVVTGAAAIEASPPADLLSLADDLGDRVGTEFPPPGQFLTGLDSRRPDRGPGDGVATDRATSATDH